MNPGEDNWGIRRLQNCILNIAEYIDEVCKREGIEYCLMGGSALGAVRHKGFIPWDDDLDIFMRPDDYARFREYFMKNGDQENFYLQEWGASNGMVTLSKLRYNFSSLLEKDLVDWDVHQGIYVDIFILHDSPDNRLARMNQYLWSKYLVAKGAANRKYDRKGGLVGLCLKILSLMPKRFLLNYALKQVYRYDGRDSENYCHFLGRAGLKKGLYPKKYFSSFKPVPFESIMLSVPSQVENYLHDRWGDYMKLPSLEEIKHFQHSWKWSDKDAFPGYKESQNYADEAFLLA